MPVMSSAPIETRPPGFVSVTSREEQELIEQIGLHLDGEALIRAIGFQIEKLRVLGSSIKTPCFVHGDTKLATLLIVPEKHSAKCLVSTCPASGEISLVRLIALWKGVDDIDGALEAANLTGIHLAENRFAPLLESWLATAKQFMADGKIDESRALYARAAKLAPNNVSVLLESARAAEAANDPQGAVRSYIKSAHAVMRSGQPEEGVRILREEVLRISPTEREILEEVAWAFAALDKAEEGALILTTAAEVVSDPMIALAMAGSAREVAPSSISIEMKHAQLLAAHGQAPLAVETFADIAARMNALDDTALECEALKGALVAEPDRRDLLERLITASKNAETLGDAAGFLDDLAAWNNDAPALLIAAARARAESSSAESARALYQRALSAFAVADDNDSIRALYEELVDGFSDGGFWREGFGEWLATRGEIQAAVSQLRARIDELADSRDEQRERLRLLERMVEIDSFAPEIRRVLAHTRTLLGQEEEAEADYLEAAHQYEQQQKEAERLEVLEELVRELPSRDKGLQVLSDALIADDRRDDAILCLRGAIERRHAGGLKSGSVWVFERLLELQPDDLNVQGGLARAHEECGDATAAVDTWRLVADAHLAQQAHDKAAAALAESVRIRPEDLDLRMQRLDVLDSFGDDAAYHAEALEFLQIATTASETSRAEKVIRRLNEKFPDDISTAERMAELEISSGKEVEGCDRLHAAALATAAKGDAASAARLLHRVLEIDASRVELIGPLVAELEKTGSRKDLLAGLLRIAENQFNVGEQSIALDCIARYEARAEWQWDKLLMSCQMLVSHRLEDRALAIIRNFLKSSTASTEGMISACQFGLEFAKDDRGLAEKLFSLNEAEGTEENILQAGLRLSAILTEQGDRKGAIKVLESLKEKYPSARKPRMELTRVYEESSRKFDAKRELAAIATILMDEARLADACQFFQRAMELDPQDFDTGLSYISCLERLNERAAAADEVRRLCHVAIEQRDLDRAEHLFARMFELVPDDMTARSEYVKFLCGHSNAEKAANESLQVAHRWFREGKADNGIEWAHTALGCLPDSAEMAIQVAGLFYQHDQGDEAVSLLAGMAGALRDKGQLDDATALIREGLARAEEDPILLAELAEIALAGDRRDECLATLRKLAVLHDEAGRMRESEETWRRTLEISPESTADHEELIAVLQRQGSSRKADTLETLKRLCAFYLSRDKRVDAITCYERQLEIDPQLLDVRSELAHACFEEGRYKAATQQFLLVAAAYRQAGKIKMAIDYLGKVLELDPQNLEALQTQVELTLSEGRTAEFADYSLRLASLLESAGRGDESIAVLRTAVEVDRENLEVRLILASHLLKGGKPTESMGIYIETARRHLAKKEKAKAVEVLDRARSLSDLDTATLEAIAEQYLACDEKVTAQLLLRTVAESARHSADEATLERASGALVSLLVAEGRIEEAVEWQLDLARVQVSQGKVGKARALLDKIGESRPEDISFHQAAAAIWADNSIPELAAQEYLHLARLCMEAQDWQQARTWCGKALEGRPREIVGREMLATCLKELGDTQQGCDVLAQLAGMYEDALQPEGAAEVLARIVEIQPDEPSYLERLADALGKLGRKDELAGSLRILAQVHEKRGDLEKAIESLRRLKDLRPDDTRVRSSFIRLHRHLGRERAILGDMLHLANLQVRRGDREEAFATLHEAAELDPTWPDGRDRLLSLYLEDGNNEQAIESALALVETHLGRSSFRDASITVQRIKRLAAEDPRFHLAQANIHMAQNARGMALREYEEAAKLFATAGDLSGRTASMARIIEIDPQNLDIRHDLIDCLRQQGKVAAATEAQRQLAEVYCNRGLWDLAEAEYRDIVSIDPEDHTAWQALFNAHLEIGDERDLIPDYMRVSQVMLQAKNINDALHYLAKVTTLDPQNIEARRHYIDAYMLVGSESELCEDYLRLADLLIEAGRIDEGIEFYNHVMTIDPGNTRVRERLSETQVRIATGLLPFPPAKEGDSGTAEKLAVTSPSMPEIAPTAASSSPGGAAEFLADEIENLERDDQAAALEQVIASYRDILAINAQNANVRIKLADLYLQQDERDKALEELRAASQTLLNKGELVPCIAVCERILKMVPTDLKIRNRLKQAFNKRDAFKALESAILFSDGNGGDNKTEER